MYLLSTFFYNQPHNLKWTFFLSLSSCCSLSHHWLSLPYYLLQREITSVVICILCICVTPFANKFLRAGTIVVGIMAPVIIFLYLDIWRIAFFCLLWWGYMACFKEIWKKWESHLRQKQLIFSTTHFRTNFSHCQSNQ